jgi:flagellar motor switch protein FliG
MILDDMQVMGPVKLRDVEDRAAENRERRAAA